MSLYVHKKKHDDDCLQRNFYNRCKYFNLFWKYCCLHISIFCHISKNFFYRFHHYIFSEKKPSNKRVMYIETKHLIPHNSFSFIYLWLLYTIEHHSILFIIIIIILYRYASVHVCVCMYTVKIILYEEHNSLNIIFNPKSLFFMCTTIKFY